MDIKGVPVFSQEMNSLKSSVTTRPTQNCVSKGEEGQSQQKFCKYKDTLIETGIPQEYKFMQINSDSIPKEFRVNKG